MRDAFLTERDAHCVRDADYVCDARLRRVSGTHCITYHSEAASLIIYLQNNLICGIIQLDKLEFDLQDSSLEMPNTKEESDYVRLLKRILHTSL